MQWLNVAGNACWLWNECLFLMLHSMFRQTETGSPLHFSICDMDNFRKIGYEKGSFGHVYGHVCFCGIFCPV